MVNGQWRVVNDSLISKSTINSILLLIITPGFLSNILHQLTRFGEVQSNTYITYNSIASPTFAKVGALSLHKKETLQSIRSAGSIMDADLGDEVEYFNVQM
jgi:hypothetical protein